VIAAGAFATALTGVAVGAGVGALAGALIGMGIPENEANWYEERVKGGAWLVSVNASGRYDEVRRILHESGGEDYERGTSTSYRSWNETAPEFRSNYERQYGTSSRVADYDAAHRFGYEAYGRNRQGPMRDWQSSEPALRREWEHQGTGSWDQNRSHIHHGYDYGRGRTRFRDYDHDAGSTMAGTMREAKGTVEQAAGEVTGSSRLEAKGEADRLRGKAEKA
jgi:hypothetical protein